jgi:hypothetical protein
MEKSKKYMNRISSYLCFGKVPFSLKTKIALDELIIKGD